MNSYRLKKERQRTLFSCAVVAGSILLLFLISLISGMFGFEDFNEYSGPVKITFGTPEGLDELLDSSELMDPEDMEEPIVEPEPVAEPEPEVVESITEPVVEPEPTKPEPAIESKPEIVKPEPLPQPAEKNVKEVTKPVNKPAPEPKPVVQKGEENGNSHETTFESTSSKIGRRAYFPIYQFMPLPESLPESFFLKIVGDITGMGEENYNRTVFLRYYSVDSGVYSLNGSIPLQTRPEIWGILEEAGYDMDNPEYKTKYHLNYVIISFEINSNSNGINAIGSAQIESTSGYKEIDDAVLYGFKQSTYSNSTDSSVKGRFKYSFK